METYERLFYCITIGILLLAYFRLRIAAFSSYTVAVLRVVTLTENIDIDDLEDRLRENNAWQGYWRTETALERLIAVGAVEVTDSTGLGRLMYSLRNPRVECMLI